MGRKTPIKHGVKASTRSRSYVRGEGQRTSNPQGSSFRSAPSSSEFDRREKGVLKLNKKFRKGRSVKAKTRIQIGFGKGKQVFIPKGTVGVIRETQRGSTTLGVDFLGQRNRIDVGMSEVNLTK